MREIVERVFQEYLAAVKVEYKNHSLGSFIRRDAPDAISAFLTDNTITIQGLCGGKNGWRLAPQIILSEKKVHSIIKGYYVEYVFAADMENCYLALGQSISHVAQQCGHNIDEILLQRAELIRTRIPDYSCRFEAGPIDLKASVIGYEAEGKSIAFAKRYKSKNLPDAAEFQDDLLHMLNLYKRLIWEVGADLAEVSSEIQVGDSMEIEEQKQYSEHKRIERHINVEQVKRLLGYNCVVCDFNYTNVYGQLGCKYIEAHHLQPFADLKPGAIRKLDIKTDFAVLCANCHRMIHRQPDPSDVNGLKKIISNGTS